MLELTTQQAMELAIQQHQEGKLHEAETIYRLVLQQEPNNPDVLHLLGVIAYQNGLCEPAVKLIRQAIAIKSSAPEYHNNLGNALKDLGQFDRAADSFRDAIALDPAFADAHYNLGRVLQEQGQVDKAVLCYQRAVALNPQHAHAHNNLGNIARDRGQFDHALASFHKAIALQPNFAVAHYNLGLTLSLQWQLDQAIAAYQTAIELQPDFVLAMVNLGNALTNAGRLDEALSAYRKAIATNPHDPGAHSNLIFTMNFHPDYNAGAVLQESRRWQRQHAGTLETFVAPHFNDRSPRRRLRIGYISADFRNHALGRNMLPLFRAHQHDQFEIFCYSGVTQPDAITNRFKSYADTWREIAGLSDQQVADLIRSDGIDILVDLTLHMAGSRLLIPARKPVPVQVTFGGYPGGTGLKNIDYRLTDPHLDPPGLHDDDYAEQSIRLPDSFWCYEPLSEQPAVNVLPAISNGYLTFGCLNNFSKVNDGALKLWAKVLHAVPNSHLALVAPAGNARQRTLDVLRGEGIAANRVEFIDRQPWERYLQLFHRIDICLDTFPYNGHTTSLDSFWMGVPVVTLVGQTTVARAGWSQLNNLGLQELAAQTPEQFVRIAADLAKDLHGLQGLRADLRTRMQSSPLMDAPRFAAGIEAAYWQMWRRWCEQSAPVATKSGTISVIICNVDPAKWATITQMYEALLANEPHEIIGIHDARSLCDGYQRGMMQATGDILVFSHDDVEFLSPDFAHRLRAHLAKYDLVGVAGTTRLVGAIWDQAGLPHLFGQVAHPDTGGYMVSIYGAPRPAIDNIQALDGLFLACRADIARKIGWDPVTFDGWHCYDVDFTFRAHLAGYKLAVCNDLLPIHYSGGDFGEKWQPFAEKFMAKFRGKLFPAPPRPFRCAAVLAPTKPDIVELMTSSYRHAQEASGN